MDKAMPHVSPRPGTHSVTQPDPEENSVVTFEPYDEIIDKPKEDGEIVTNRKDAELEMSRVLSSTMQHLKITMKWKRLMKETRLRTLDLNT